MMHGMAQQGPNGNTSRSLFFAIFVFVFGLFSCFFSLEMHAMLVSGTKVTLCLFSPFPLDVQ